MDSMKDTLSPRAVYSTLFLILSGLFIMSLIVANTIASKIIVIGPLSVAAGILCFPISYIISDVLTEVYGYQKTRNVIWLGFFCLGLTSLIYFAATQLSPAPFYSNEVAFDAIFSQVPRIAVGSLAGFLVGSILNAAVMSRMKVMTDGRFLWMRTIGSTIIGEGADSLVFAVIAFGGIFELEALLLIAFSGFLLKTIYEVVATPLTYAIVAGAKSYEKIDTFDRSISYRPF